jgi:hypothetical protein
MKSNILFAVAMLAGAPVFAQGESVPADQTEAPAATTQVDAPTFVTKVIASNVFLKQQADTHDEAIRLFTAYAETGDNAALLQK